MNTVLFLQFKVFVKIINQNHFSYISTYSWKIFNEFIAHLHSMLPIESKWDDWQVIEDEICIDFKCTSENAYFIIGLYFS